MKLFTNDPADIFQNIKSFVTYKTGNNRLGASIKQLNELLVSSTRTAVNAETQRTNYWEVSTPGGVAPTFESMLRINSGSGIGLVSEGKCQPCTGCGKNDCCTEGARSESDGCCSSFYACGGTAISAFTVNPDPGVGGYIATLALPTTGPAAMRTALIVGNVKIPGFVTVQKISETEYIVNVVDALGAPVANPFDKTIIQIVTFYNQYEIMDTL